MDRPRWIAASASAANRALLNGPALPATWTILTVPSRIRIGAAAIDFFFLRESGTVLIDQDIETTVADPDGSRSEVTRIVLGVVAILTVFLVAR